MKTSLLINRDRLRRMRIRKGMTQLDLAAAAGVADFSIHRAERLGQCGLVVARKIAAVFGLEVGDLLADEVEAPAKSGAQ